MDTKIVKALNTVIKGLAGIEAGSISDGYHTFDELYEFRLLYNVALFNKWAIQGKYNVHKSKRHYDGEICFEGYMFKVSAMLPDGEISNHYSIKDWDLFQCQKTEKAIYPYDNHTSNDVLFRLRKLAMSDYISSVIDEKINTELQKISNEN